MHKRYWRRRFTTATRLIGVVRPTPGLRASSRASIAYPDADSSLAANAEAAAVPAVSRQADDHAPDALGLVAFAAQSGDSADTDTAFPFSAH
ncbi:MAG: hypothetical protein R3E48_15110 [Burkholderiaceae bacterium]